MMKVILLTAVVVALVLACAPVHATPLQITEGAISSVTFGVSDARYIFGGDGFSIDGQVTGGGGYFGGRSFSINFTALGVEAFPTQVIVDGVGSCQPIPGFGGTSCGFVNLTIDPFPPNQAFPYDETVHFTATGRIPTIGDGFDLVGEGYARWQISLNFQTTIFTFVVPEPPTVWLLAVVLIALGVTAQRIGASSRAL